jgi:hypothetical protein
LKLKYYKLLSTSAFDFNLRRYITAAKAGAKPAADAAKGDAANSKVGSMAAKAAAKAINMIIRLLTWLFGLLRPSGSANAAKAKTAAATAATAAATASSSSAATAAASSSSAAPVPKTPTPVPPVSKTAGPDTHIERFDEVRNLGDLATTVTGGRGAGAAAEPSLEEVDMYRARRRAMYSIISLAGAAGTYTRSHFRST